MRDTTYKGIGFLDLLCVALIVLKLLGVIELSWVWVLAPFWIPLVIALIVVTVVCLIALLVFLLGVK